MQRGSGPEVPRTLEDLCAARTVALIVYDMQVGIAGQLPDSAGITARVAEVLGAARDGGVPVFFSRHTSLPRRLMGASQVRQQMAWQRVEDPAAVVSPFPPDAPHSAIVQELAPLPDEAVSDKISMSAFEGTFLNTAMRDLGLQAFAIVGIATEIGIEPTVRHGADLGYVPVIVADACGAGHAESARHALELLDHAGDAIFTSVEEISPLLRAGASEGATA